MGTAVDRPAQCPGVILRHTRSRKDRHLRAITGTANHTPGVRRPARRLDHDPTASACIGQHPADVLVGVSTRHVDILQRVLTFVYNQRPWFRVGRWRSTRLDGPCSAVSIGPATPAVSGATHWARPAGRMLSGITGCPPVGSSARTWSQRSPETRLIDGEPHSTTSLAGPPGRRFPPQSLMGSDTGITPRGKPSPGICVPASCGRFRGSLPSWSSWTMTSWWGRSL